jgi:O-antigen/teichoic acid export membrane protein
MSLERHLPRLAGSFGATALLQIAGFISGVLVARMLGPADRGHMAQIVAWYSFLAPLALIGLDEASTFLLSSAPKPGVLASILAAGAGTALLALAACASAYVFVFSGQAWPVRVAAAIFLLYAPFFHLYQVSLATLQAGGRSWAWNLTRSAVTPLYIVFILVAALVDGGSLVSLVAANVAALVVGALVAVGLAASAPAAGKPSWPVIRQLFAFGRFTVFQRLTIVSRDNLDRMLLPLFVSMSDLGQYAVAAAIAYFIFLIGFTLDLVAFPAIAKAAPDESRRLAASFVRLGVAATVSAVAIALALVDWIVPLVFGPAFQMAATLAKPLIVAGGFQSVKMLFSSVLKGMNRPKIIAAVEIVNVLLMVGSLLVLTPLLGAIGAALAQTIAAAVTCAILVWLTCTRLTFSWPELLIPRPSDALALARTVTRGRGGSDT